MLMFGDVSNEAFAVAKKEKVYILWANLVS